MKASVLCSILLTTVAGVSAAAASVESVAVSPGTAGAFHFVANSCPTFSWGAVDGAELYELAVFAVPKKQGPRDTAGEVVLGARIPGSALSWTPSRERCLGPGRYSWSVRAVGAGAAEGWSEPLFFAVDRAAAELQGKAADELAGFSEEELETAVRRILENYLKAGDQAAGGDASGGAARATPKALAPPEARGDNLNTPPALFSLTGASAAFRADVGAEGGCTAPVFGVAGVTTNCSNSAGVIASHWDQFGADLVLDAPLGGIPALLNQDQLRRDDALPTTFGFVNWGAGVLNLEVDGALTTHASSHNLKILPFYVKLSGNGSTQDIATNGTLRVFVRCLVGLNNEVLVIATNTAAGWFTNSGSTSWGAGAEIVVQSRLSSLPAFDNFVDSFFAVAPDGSYLAIDGDTLALGVKAFGSDCIAAGTITSLDD